MPIYEMVFLNVQFGTLRSKIVINYCMPRPVGLVLFILLCGTIQFGMWLISITLCHTWRELNHTLNYFEVFVL